MPSPSKLSLRLLSQIDACANDILFFADEGGSWEVGVDWARVLPAWFRVLSATVGPAECAQRIATTLRCHYEQGRIKMLAVARRIATPTQRPAFTETVSPRERSIDPFILFVVFLVCRYISRCRGLVDGLSDFFVVGVGQVN